MPFLLPAVVALVCDICIVWLSYYSQRHSAASNSDSESHWVYYTIDVYCGSVPSVARLFILCIPLLYHSYTGTALRHVLWYRTIYICMTLLVVFHALAYFIVNPKSFESMFIVPTSDQEYEYRRLWLIIVFNCVSLAFHNFLIRHVRSTAPTPPMMLRMLNQHKQRNRTSYLCRRYISNNVQPTMYFAVRTAAAAVTATKKVVVPTSIPSTGSVFGQRRNASLPEQYQPSSLHRDDEYDSGEMEQEPALMNAMNGT
jgi:hypothetical protein